MDNGISLVTGGCGFIGRHLVQLLLEHGKAVRIVDNNPNTGELGGAVDIRTGSVLDQKLLTDALEGVSVVYHLAAIPHLWARNSSIYQEVNVEGTKSVLKTATEVGIHRFVYTSSETVLRGWRDRSSTAINEQQPLPEITEMAGPYSKSKLQAELEVVRAIDEGFPANIVYPTIPVGPGDINLTPPTRMIRDFLNEKNPAYLECNLNLIPVKTVAAGHLAAVEKGSVGERYILGQENLKMTGLLKLIEDISGKKMPRQKVSYYTALLTARAMELTAKFGDSLPSASVEGVRVAGANMIFDSSKAHQELDLPRNSIREALEETISWLLKQ